MDSLEGTPVYKAKFRCPLCSNPIHKRYAQSPAGTCWHCGKGDQDISPIEKIEAVGLYFVKRDWGDASGEVINDLISFARELQAAKNTEYTEKMATLLSLGVVSAGYENFDTIVIPPSSSSQNHMIPKAELVSDRFDMSFKDVIIKISNTGSMKGKSTAKARKQAAQGNYRCETDVTGERVLILDDIVTTTNTVVAVAKAVMNQGASQIGAVSMARTVNLYTLTDKNLIN